MNEQLPTRTASAPIADGAEYSEICLKSSAATESKTPLINSEKTTPDDPMKTTICFQSGSSEPHESEILDEKEQIARLQTALTQERARADDLERQLNAQAAAFEEEKNSLLHELGLEQKSVRVLLGMESVTKAELERIRQVMRSFLRGTFSGTTMKVKISDEEWNSYLAGMNSSVGGSAGSQEQTQPGNGSQTQNGGNSHGVKNAQNQSSTSVANGNSHHRGRPEGSTGSYLDKFADDCKVEERVELPPEERICPKCGETMTLCGYTYKDVLCHQPERFYKKRICYATYKCLNCEKNGENVLVRTARPEPFLAHSTATPEAVATFAVKKLLLGVPMHTQAAYYASQGYPISKQTICNHLMRAAEDYVIPLANLIQKRILEENDIAFSDGTFDAAQKEPKKRHTVMCVTAPKGSPFPGSCYIYDQPRTKERVQRELKPFAEGTTRTEKVSPVDGLDEEATRNLMEILDICSTPSTGKRPAFAPLSVRDLLKECETELDKKPFLREALDSLPGKFLHSDGLSSYQSIEGVIDCCCAVHGRAKIFRSFCSKKSLDDARLELQILMDYGQLYALEGEYGSLGLSYEQRFQRRLKDSYPIYKRIFAAAKENLPKCKPGLLRDALKYIVNQERFMLAFFLDGRLSPDNTMSERHIKYWARLRRNSLHHMTKRGGVSDAGYMTVFRTGEMWGLDPWKYLLFVLQKGAEIRPQSLDDILSGEWATELLPDKAPDWCKR